jgi:hypothetical protein
MSSKKIINFAQEARRINLVGAIKKINNQGMNPDKSIKTCTLCYKPLTLENAIECGIKLALNPPENLGDVCYRAIGPDGTVI